MKIIFSAFSAITLTCCFCFADSNTWQMPELTSSPPVLTITATNLAGAEERAKLYLEAAQDYERHPEHYTVDQLLFIARGYMLEEKYSQAMPLYKKFLIVQPTNTLAIRGLGACYAFTKQYDEAASQFKQGWMLGDDVALNNLANLYFMLGRFADIKPLVSDLLKAREQVTDNDKKHEISNDLIAYSLNAKPSADKEVFLKTIDGLSDEFILERKDTAQSVILGLKTFGYEDRAKQLDDKMVTRKKAEALFNEGVTNYQSGDYLGAISNFNEVVQLGSKDANTMCAYYNLGNVKFELGKYEEAIELNFGYWPNYYNRGNSKLVLEDLPGAMADYDKAIELNPNAALAYQELGFLQNNLGQWRPALTNLYKSLKIDPSLTYSRLYIWSIRSRLGEKDAATQELAEYIQSLKEEKADEWPVKIGQYLIGTLSYDDFLRAARASARNQEEKKEQLCRICYYNGMKRLLAGDRGEASRFFNDAAFANKSTIPECYSAKAEWGALVKMGVF
jgi:tetratricopeptide (TPR) repeat protein